MLIEKGKNNFQDSFDYDPEFKSLTPQMLMSNFQDAIDYNYQCDDDYIPTKILRPRLIEINADIRSKAVSVVNPFEDDKSSSSRIEQLTEENRLLSKQLEGYKILEKHIIDTHTSLHDPLEQAETIKKLSLSESDNSDESHKLINFFNECIQTSHEFGTDRGIDAGTKLAIRNFGESGRHQLMANSRKQAIELAPLVLQLDKEHKTLQEIADILNKKGTNKNGNPWEPSNVLLLKRKIKEIYGMEPEDKDEQRNHWTTKIKALREQGNTLQAIADILNADEESQKQGRSWHPTSVKNFLEKAVISKSDGNNKQSR